jgi:hypothetical protein
VGLLVALAVMAAGLLASPAGAGAAPSTADVAVFSPGGEPEIAVNPRDARDLVMGENVYGVSYSRDGGATWKHVAVANIGDNALAVEPNGTFLFTSINGTVWASRDGGAAWSDVGNWVGAVAETAYKLDPFPYPAGNGVGDVIRDVACNTPDDGGAGPLSTDVPPDGPGVQLIGCDRPWLAADPNTGRVYVSFSDHEDASGGTGGKGVPWELGTLACRANDTAVPAFECGRQYVSASGDGGRKWTIFRPMDTSDYPAAGTNGWSGGPTAAFGTLATSYVATGIGCAPCVVFETSTNDGTTWDQHVVAPVSFPTNQPPNCSVVACGDGSGVDTSLNFEPYTAADPSRPGRYAVMFFDGSQSHLLVYVTDDLGETWHSVALAEPGGGVKRWVPWIRYGPSGALGVMWITSYADGSFDTWADVAPKGGTDFEAPVRLSSARSAGPVAPGGDDNSDVTLTRDTLYAAWGDQRGTAAQTGWFGSNGDRVGSYRFAQTSTLEHSHRRHR